MDILKNLVIIFISFSSGAVIASAVFAFIAIIGIVPSLASKTNTTKYINLYEEMIIFGGIFGCINTVVDYNILLGVTMFGKFLIILFFTSIGVFVGILASSLAEVIDVIPIFSKRINIKKNLAILMLAIAIGKAIGSIIYFIRDGFQIY